MKKYILCHLLALLSMISYAQDPCETQVEKATKILKNPSPFKNYQQLVKHLQPCADQGNAKAQNYLGLFYIVRFRSS